MKFKINKIALSLATAFLMVSSVVSMATSAAGTNEITLKADKTNAQAGDKINVTVGYTPDSQGVAGFTINLHYDSSKVSVYIPSEDELDSTYNVGSKFSVITNYGATGESIKIVGANLSSTNIKAATNLALATFTVKDGASGDINYWVDVETIVKTADDGYETASYSAPTQNAPYVVNGPAGSSTTVTTTKTAATTTSAATTSQTTTTTQKATTTSEVTTSEAVTTKATTTEISQTQTNTTTTTTAPVTTTPAETTTTAQTTLPNAEPLFEYVQGTTDFNSETSLQYAFNLSDYLSDYSQNVDVKVSISTTGGANGAIGLIAGGEWTSQPSKISEAGNAVWCFENLNPNSSSDLVYLQLYYLKANSDFKITSIEVTPVNVPEVTTTTQATETAVVTTTQPAETEPTTTTKATSVSSDETVSTTTTALENANENAVTNSVTNKNDDSTAVVTTLSKQDEGTVSSTTPVAEQIESMVDNASKTTSQADASTANPSTGTGRTVVTILTIAALLGVAYSLFAVVYNKAAIKDDEE